MNSDKPSKYMLTMFSTVVWVCQLDIKNEIENEVNEFIKKSKSVQNTNRGGDQYDRFSSQNFAGHIGNSIPSNPENPIGKFRVHSWVNVNKKGDYNERHTHLGHLEKINNSEVSLKSGVGGEVFLCGVYYLKVPKGSGEIRFYDPRGPIVRHTQCQQYYFGDVYYDTVTPEEDTMIFFPPWFEHSVSPTQTNEERISISFNVFLE
jgi:hypothetical protein